MVFDGPSVRITKPGGAIVATGTLTGRRLYALDGRIPDVEHALIAGRIPTLDTWHKRLGHANHRTVHDMVRLGSATGMPCNLSPVPSKCEHCILGKQTRSAVPKVREGEKAERRGGSTYLDLQGPASVRSATGNLYSLDIVDDKTSMSWAIPIPSKEAAFPALRNWVLAREVELGHKLGKFQIDNGELLSTACRAFLAERGYSQRLTAPYTSAQNGRVERLHRTLMDRARAMRLAANVPPNRWDEFLVTANYLTTRTPSRSLPGGMTPFEAWHGRKPDLSHLREIGCRAFVLIQNTHNPKIYERSVECVLIGYGADSKTYRCYHRGTHKIISSYHVAFIGSHETATAPSPIQNSPSSQPPIPVTDDETPILSPVAPVPAPVLADSSSRVDSVNTVTAPAASLPDAPIPLRRSSRTPQPTQRRAEAEGLPYKSRLERTVAAIREACAKDAALHDVVDHAPTLPGAHASHTSAPPPPSAPPAFDVPDIPSNPPDLDDSQAALAADGALPMDVEYPGDPRTRAEADASPYAAQWADALRAEMKSFKDLGVYRLIPRTSVPTGKTILKGKPVYRLKRDEAGHPTRFKARWVAKGFQAVYGKDYTRTPSPTMRMESFRLLAHLASSLGWDLEQLDVKTAFLYGILPEDERCYMEQPDGFEEPGTKGSHVWELLRGIYGTKQGSRTWNVTMNDYLVKDLGFTRLACEFCIYYRTTRAGTVFTGVHVDDFLLAASSPDASAEFKRQLRLKWEISDLGEAKFCVGICLERNRAARTISLSQVALIDKIIHEFRLDAPDCQPVSTPMESGLQLSRIKHAPQTPAEKAVAARLPYRALIGCLMYLAIGTRPDVALAVQYLSQFLDCYNVIHWEAAKRVV